MDISRYYIAINIKLLKFRDKSQVTSVQLSLDIAAHLLEIGTFTRMPSHAAVV